ncbi:MAG: hypothetical protein ACI9OJ_006082 [Myxococcota bacterium]|jgi:hypothetical protein
MESPLSSRSGSIGTRQHPRESMVESAQIRLTPFVAPLQERADQALRHLLGLPAHIEVDWHVSQRPPNGWRVHVRIASDLELDVFNAAPAGQAVWHVGEHLSVGLRASASDPTGPLLLQLRRRLLAMDQRDDGAPDVVRAMAEVARFDGVTDWMFREVSPREALIRLGFRCNQDCAFCWQDRDWPEPPVEFYSTWLDEMAQSGTRRVSFSGGEPTIHRELLPLIRRAVGHAMEVEIQTNAVRLAKAGYAEKLVEAGASGLFVSFHSHIGETSDAMTRAPRTWARTVEGVGNALAAGMTVDLNCVVESRNYETLGDHARFIVSRFVTPHADNRPARVIYSHPCEYHSIEEWRAGLVPLDVLKPHLLEAVSVLDAANVPVEGIGTCGFPPCLLAEAPSLQRVFVRQAQSDSDVSGRAFGKTCDECAMRPHCLGVRREYLEAHGERGLSAFDRPPLDAVFERLPHTWAQRSKGPLDAEKLQLHAGLRRLIKRERSTPEDAHRAATDFASMGFKTAVFEGVGGDDQRAIAFAGSDSAAIEAALAAESDLLGTADVRANAVRRLGELLGYPSCCVEALIDEPNQDDPSQIRRLAVSAESAPKGSLRWSDNWASHQLRPFSLFPCHTGCLAARALAERTVELFVEASPAYGAAVRDALQSVAIVQPSVHCFALLEGAEVDGETVRYRDVLSHRNLGIIARDPALGEAEFRTFYLEWISRLESADEATRTERGLRLTRRNRLVCDLRYPQYTPTYLLDFT